MNEEELEHLAIDWFQQGGWDYIYGPDLEPHGKWEERSFSEVILKDRLLKSLKAINPNMDSLVLEEVIHRITKTNHPSLVQNNFDFHEALKNGVEVEVEKEGEKRGDRVQLIDFQNPLSNQFLVVNQFSVKGTRGLRRPDMVCFINGLPIAVIELKNPTKEKTDIWEAYNQLQTYKTEISDLFIFNEALVISDGFQARVGSLTSPKERFSPWRAIRNENDRPIVEYELEKLIRGFFATDLLLDYLRYFILYENSDTSGGLIKKIAAYHQFHGIRQATLAAVIASSNSDGESIQDAKVKPGSKKGGIIWHTQGSGKSISMICLVAKLMSEPKMENPTIVILTDRNNLDGQLFQTFSNSKSLLGEVPQQAQSTQDLVNLLKDKPSGGIIFTTIQKFSPLGEQEQYQLLSDRSNIVVIADEAHRSQYGFRAALNDSGQYRYGYAKYLRDGLPNATFVGFTGTPVSLQDKDTKAVFGDYVSIYDIQDAVEDEATVPIYYESRLAKLDLNQAKIEQLNHDVEEVLEGEEDEGYKQATKTQWAALEKLVGATPRLKQVAADIVKHFQQRSETIEGKAMIVCMSREICVRLYDEIVALVPEWDSPDPNAGEIKVVMTGSASDPELLRPHIYNSSVKKHIEKRFKDPNDPLKIVIVRDMWLTGFDVPSLHSIYIDKPMKGHNLMQAIARVNRVFSDKKGGLVIDYIGIASELRQALATYTQSRGRGAPTIDTQQALDKLEELVDIARGIFYGFDYSSYQTAPNELLIPAANYILGLQDGKKRFFDTVVGITKAFSLCGTLDQAQLMRQEIAFFQAVKAVITKATTSDKKLSQENKNAVLKQILDNAVVAEGVDDIFSLAGIEKPDLGILSEGFLEEVRMLPQKDFAVELLNKLLNDEIKSISKTNVIIEKTFSDRLVASIARYHNRSIESSEVIKELIEMAKEFKKASQRGEQLGLSEAELAFYDALSTNESAILELGDETLKKIALELTQKLRKSTTIDWQKRQSVRAHLRNLVRVTLRHYKYPPDRQDETIQLILEQAERLSYEWSR